VSERHARVRQRAASDTLNAVIAIVPPVGSRSRGRLDGAPVAIKDNVAVAGIATTNASAACPSVVPAADATVVRRLRAAGADVFCKANMHELGAASISPAFGSTHNPHDRARSSGGSSSGCAALVGAGVCDFAVGTDVGGSVRIPAAFCGVVGFKPSSGRIPLDGVVPTCPTCDHVGVIAASVRQAAALFGVVAGTRVAVRRVRAPRIGVLGRQLEDPLLDASVRDAVLDALARAEAAGAVLIDVDDEDLDAQARDALGTIALREALTLHHAHAAYGPGMQALLAAAQWIDESDYRDALAVRESLHARARRRVDHVDVVAGPTVPVPPFERDPQFGQPGSDLDGHFTTLHGLLGLPALTLPCAEPANALPAGLQIAARPSADATLLSVGQFLETALATV
jgi:aspartyl-tRNA(Asn)/glutamyl-tRNA(Gln) amidotransferase subunit A